MPCRVIVLTFALTLGIASPCAAHAQLPAGSAAESSVAAALGLTPGTRVRYATRLAPYRYFASTLVRAERDTLWLRGERAVAVHDLAQFQVSAGRRSLGSRMARGASWGGVLGGILGAIPEGNPRAIVGPRTRAEGAAFGALVGLTIGGIGGALLGRERWREVRAPGPGSS